MRVTLEGGRPVLIDAGYMTIFDADDWSVTAKVQDARASYVVTLTREEIAKLAKRVGLLDDSL